MCTPYRNTRTKVYSCEINPPQLCKVDFSFGFYRRNNHRNLNPYNLLPFENIYPGPFSVWTFGATLRIRCMHTHNFCNQNIELARNVHKIWHKSPIWLTHPDYVNNSAGNQSVDFIAETHTDELYIVRGLLNPDYYDIRIWLNGNNLSAPAGIKIVEVDVLPASGFDLFQWIIDRVNDINRLDVGLKTIPVRL